MRKYLVLALALMFTCSTPVYAATSQVENISTYSDNYEADVSVGVTQGSSYKIILPKTVSIDPNTGIGQYTVSVQGDMNPNQEIAIECTDTILLTDETGRSEPITFNVSNYKKTWTWEDLESGQPYKSDEILTLKEGESLPAGDFTGTLTFNVSCRLCTVDGFLTAEDLERLGYDLSTATHVDIPASINLGNGDIKTITGIAQGIFKDNNAIQTVTVAEGITSIGPYVFSNCPNLTSVQLPSTIESIGEYAFLDSSNLASVNIPKNIKKIKECSFKNSGITSLDFTGCVNDVLVYNEAFRDCDSLVEINFNTNSIIDLEHDTFRDCGSIEEVNVPSNVNLDNKCFMNCSSLKTVTVDSSDGKIDKEAFNMCENLETVTLKGVTKIDNQAFKDCTNLSSLNLDTQLQTVEEEAFYNCKSLQQLPLHDTLTTLGKYAFYECKAATGDYTFPTGVSVVPEYVFYNCKNINSITFPGTVTEVQQRAFRDCSVGALAFSEGLVTVGEDAFSYSDGYDGRAKLSSISLPDSVTTLGCSAFKRADIESFRVPAGVTELKEETFMYSDILTIELHEGITSFGYACFAECDLTDISIPSLVTEIPARCFYNSDSLTVVTIPTNVISIAEEAFVRCSGLTKVNVPTSTNVDSLAFSDTSVVTRY